MGYRMGPEFDPRVVHFANLIPRQHANGSTGRNARTQLAFQIFDEFAPFFTVQSLRTHNRGSKTAFDGVWSVENQLGHGAVHQLRPIPCGKPKSVEYTVVPDR